MAHGERRRVGSPPRSQTVIAALGVTGLWIALASATLLTVYGIAGARHPAPASARCLRLPAIGVFAGAAWAMLALEAALLTDDFSVAYVAERSASTTPLLYKIASAWGALEGSLVLWALVLAALVLFVWVGHSRRGEGDTLGAGALAILGFISLFFLVVLATISNPFEICTATSGYGCAQSSPLPWAAAVTPAEGWGPNPLLQNHPLMAAHPPVLYIGFVGLTVPFAFALSALAGGESGAGWLQRTRSWTRVAWVFLTAGIVLGGLWSYEVLGWGGYWAWDPVENTSFWAWVLATMFLHSSALQLRRGVLQTWNYLLVIVTFSSVILGTFITRSGVVISVHSFTQSPLGPTLLGFLGFVLVVSIALLTARSRPIASPARVDSLLSREGLFLINNLLLFVLAFTAVVGTLFPVFVEAFTGSDVGVGRPFFDRIAVPVALGLLVIKALGAVAPYRHARPSIVWQRVRWPLRFGLGIAALTVLLGLRNAWSLITLVLAGFVVGVAGRQLWVAARASARKAGRRVSTEWLRVMRSDPGYWGGQIAHVGIAVLALGIALSSNLAQRDELRLQAGASAQAAGFEITYLQPHEADEPSRLVSGAEVEISRDDTVLTTLRPRLNEYVLRDPGGRVVGRQPAIASPAVMGSWRGDLYLSLTSFSSQRIVLGVYWFPMMWMVWLGGFLTAAGGVWSWLVRAPARRREAKTLGEAAANA